MNKELLFEKKKLLEKVENSRFVDPQDMKRIEQINSLIITDGKRNDLQWKILKGRNTTIGLNVNKPYYRKGKVG